MSLFASFKTKKPRSTTSSLHTYLKDTPIYLNMTCSKIDTRNKTEPSLLQKPELQETKAKKETTEMESSSPNTTIQCSLCKEVKDKKDYSKNQRKKKEDTRKCKACVSSCLNAREQSKHEKANRKRKHIQVEKKQKCKRKTDVENVEMAEEVQVEKKICPLTTAEIIQKQKEMRKTALEELEKNYIKDSTLKVDDSNPIPNEEFIANFYKMFDEVLELRGGPSEGPLERIIYEYQSIFNMKHKGQILTEWICDQEESAYRRDMLFDVICLGAEVTCDCYKSILSLEIFLFEFECLLISGNMPLEAFRGEKTLDLLAQTCHYEEATYDDPSLINLFFGRAKPGDQYGFGFLPAFFVQKTLKNLPFLEEGVTHEKDGPFAEILNRYLVDFPLDEPETVEKWRKSSNHFEDFQEIEFYRVKKPAPVEVVEVVEEVGGKKQKTLFHFWKTECAQKMHGEKETKTTDDKEKMETTESGEDTQNNTNAEERDVLMSSEVDENVEMSIKDKRDTDEAEKENNEKDEPDDGTNIEKNSTAVEDDPGSTKEKASDDQKNESDNGTDIEKNTIDQHTIQGLDENENDVEDDQVSTKVKASDDQKDEPDDGTDIEKNTIAKIHDENENDVEDDQGSTKEKTLEDEKVVEVAQEDPVETSIEI